MTKRLQLVINICFSKLTYLPILWCYVVLQSQKASLDLGDDGDEGDEDESEDDDYVGGDNE